MDLPKKYEELFLRVASRAALSSFDFVGKKNKEAADQDDQDNDSDVVDADFEEVTEEKENQSS